MMVLRPFKQTLFFALFLGLLSFQNTAQADDFETKAGQFIEVLADKAITAMRSEGTEAEKSQQLRVLLNEGFDVRAIGKWVLGRNWRRATEEEKEEYLRLFEEFILVTYGNRFMDYAGQDVTFKVTQALAKDENDAVVRSEVLRPAASEPIIVDWRIKVDESRALKVVDVKVAGVSMSQTQRSEFASVIKNSGGEVSGLIDALRSKTQELAAATETSDR